MKDSFLILNQILKDLKKNKYDGVAFYSIDQLPIKIEKTKIILNHIIKNKKNIYFSLKNILISNKKKLLELLELIKIKTIV